MVTFKAVAFLADKLWFGEVEGSHDVTTLVTSFFALLAPQISFFFLQLVATGRCKLFVLFYEHFTSQDINS